MMCLTVEWRRVPRSLELVKEPSPVVALVRSPRVRGVRQSLASIANVTR